MNIKYPYIDKICPTCSESFRTKLNHKGEKTTCSHGCANSYFRKGKNAGNYKNGSSQYREIAFKEYPNLCFDCSWDTILEILVVHHIDRDRTNNEKENLMILCTNCHAIRHYNAKDGLYSFNN